MAASHLCCLRSIVQAGFKSNFSSPNVLHAESQTVSMRKEAKPLSQVWGGGPSPASRVCRLKGPCRALPTSSCRRSPASPRSLHPLEPIWDGNELPPPCSCSLRRETVGAITLGVKKTNKGVSRDSSGTSGSCKTYVVAAC